MSKLSRKSRPRPLRNSLLFLIVLVLVALASFFFLKTRTNREELASDTSSSTPRDSSESALEPSSEPKKPAAEKINSSSNSDNPDGKTPDRYDGDNPNVSESLTGAISTARLSSDGSKFLVRVNLDQYLTSGSCTLKIANRDGVVLVENSVEIVPEASTSTCAGFDLPTTELEPFETPLTIEIILTSSEKSGSLSTIFE